MFFSDFVNRSGGPKPAIFYAAVGGAAVATSLATFYNVTLNPTKRKTFADYEVKLLLHLDFFKKIGF